MRHGKGTDPLAHAGDQGSPAEILYGKGKGKAAAAKEVFEEGSDDAARNAGGALDKSGVQHAPAKEGGAPKSARDSAFAQQNMSDDEFMRRLTSVDDANRAAGGALDKSGVQYGPASAGGAPSSAEDSAYTR